MSYVSSLSVVIRGISVGWFVQSIDEVIKWIVSGLWGGYTASNVLKWYWWRFNGYGYFWGMVTGIAASLIMPKALPRILDLSGFKGNVDVALIFPIVLGISLIGCLVGTFLTKPEDEEV